MADIYHTFPINAPVDKVFGGISTSEGIDRWWTKASLGAPNFTPFINFHLGQAMIGARRYPDSWRTKPLS